MKGTQGSNFNKGFPSPGQLKWIVASLGIYFGLRLLFFAFSISHYVPPDEVTHFGLAKIFSKVLLLPENSPETYQHGLVTNIPWLYYWVMGKSLLLNVFRMSDLLFLRLLNIPFAFGTVYFASRLLRLLTDDRFTQLILVVVMTNTLMFSFLSASISYDNLTNLLAVMAIYYSFAFFKKRSGNYLALSLLCQLAGGLTKISFLPLILVLNLLLLSREFRGVRRLPSAVKVYYKESGRRALVLSLAILVGLILNLQLYGGNCLHYGKVNPGMTEVLSMESALQNRIAARDAIFMLFKEKRITYREAMRMASDITHAGDRAGTVYLLQNYLARQQRGEELLSPAEYVVPWGQRVLSTVYGVMGHLSMFNRLPTLLPLLALFLLAGVSSVLRWRPGEAAGLPVFLSLISAAYIVFLLYASNYRIYLYYENFNIGLQGRYLFPVIGPLYVLFAYFLMRLFKGRKARLAMACATALVFVLSDLPFFLYHATTDWFSAFSSF